MSNTHGYPIWYELITTDPDAAQRFYGDVVGWRAQDSGQEGMDYRILNAADGSVGGLMRLPDDAQAGGMRLTWLGYVGVDDVDACVKAITDAGGAVHMPARNIPGVGRIAMVADPQGALFYVMRGDSDAKSTSFAPTTDGHCAWNELVTSDHDAALDFYRSMFDWREVDAMHMGDMGDYSFLNHGETGIGAMINASERSPVPMWRYYFRVTDIDTATTRIEVGGGSLLNGPTEVPGGDWIIQAKDPQGAFIGFTGSREVSGE